MHAPRTGGTVIEVPAISHFEFQAFLIEVAEYPFACLLYTSDAADE